VVDRYFRRAGKKYGVCCVLSIPSACMKHPVGKRSFD
jgi:hypothetical protein